MHRVGVVAIPPVTTFDLTIPELVFTAAEVDGVSAYEVAVCAAEPGVLRSSGSLAVVVEHGLDILDGVDTVIVTGSGRREDFDHRVVAALRTALARGKRVVSICTGAFVLAEAGILDGRRATTYWPYAEELASRFPEVAVEPGVLYTDDGNVMTSAGVVAGIDLCLHIVRSDHGAVVANRVARLAVVASVRHGGQLQFIESPLPADKQVSLAPTRAWAVERLDRELTLSDLSAHAHTSVRNLTRRFKAETGMSPVQWLLRQRVDRARELLEATTLSMDQVARRCGLGSSESLRQHFVRRVGVTPRDYRASFTRRPTLT